MTALHLVAIDRELDELGVAAEKLADTRARARQLAQESGGLEGLLALVGDRAPAEARAARPAALRAPRAPAAAAPAAPSAGASSPAAAAPAAPSAGGSSPAAAAPAAPSAAVAAPAPAEHAASARPSSIPAPRPPSAPAPAASAPPAVETVVPEGVAARATTFEAEATSSPAAEREPGSGLVEVPDGVLASPEIPPVLSVHPEAAAVARESLSASISHAEPSSPFDDPLELESEPGLDVAGAAPLDSLFQSLPLADIPQTRTVAKPPSQRPPADLEAELAALFDDESEPPPPEPVPEIPEAPITFDADAMMAGHPESADEVPAEPTMLVRSGDVMLPGAPAEPAGEGDFELDFDDDVLEIDDAELSDTSSPAAAGPASSAPKSRPPEPPKSRPPEAGKSRPPPPPPKSRPPEAPGKGFLNRLLNRKG